jgi:hypothetical protein
MAVAAVAALKKSTNLLIVNVNERCNKEDGWSLLGWPHI